MKPTPDLPSHVALATGGLVREALDVVDLSVGGFALSSPLLVDTKVGDHLKLHLSLGGGAEHLVEVVARWKSADGAGFELAEPDPNVTQELHKYIAELLERGGAT